MKASILIVILLTTVFYAEGNCPDDSNGLLEKICVELAMLRMPSIIPYRIFLWM